MVGPDVIETAIDDVVLGRPTLVEETSFDHPRAVEAVVEMEVQLETCVIRELRPDVVPFDGNEVPLIAIADDSALWLFESEGFEPVDVEKIAASKAEAAIEIKSDECDAELVERVFAFGPGAWDGVELARLTPAFEVGFRDGSEAIELVVLFECDAKGDAGLAE